MSTRWAPVGTKPSFFGFSAHSGSVENPNKNLGSLFLPDPSYMLRSSDPEEKNALIGEFGNLENRLQLMRLPLERAGPREKIFFDITDEFTVGVVTCGG